MTTGATGAFASPNVANGIVVPVSGLTLAGTASGNYTLTQPTTTANITAATADGHGDHGEQQGVRRDHDGDAEHDGCSFGRGGRRGDVTAGRRRVRRATFADKNVADNGSG